MMAKSGKTYTNNQGLRVAVALIFITSLSVLPSISDCLESTSYNSKSFEQDDRVLGSRPPRCVNKCKNCWPCRASLVIPPHNDHKAHNELFHGDDDTYYLLSWKCRCGSKLYQP